MAASGLSPCIEVLALDGETVRVAEVCSPSVPARQRACLIFQRGDSLNHSRVAASPTAASTHSYGPGWALTAGGIRHRTRRARLRPSIPATRRCLRTLRLPPPPPSSPSRPVPLRRQQRALQPAAAVPSLSCPGGGQRGEPGAPVNPELVEGAGQAPRGLPA